MNNTLLYIIFTPLIAGFVLLFVPNKIKFVAKAITLIVSIYAIYLAGKIFQAKELSFSMPLLQAGAVNIDLILAAKPLGSFMLFFSSLFGLLITMYSLKPSIDIKRENEFFGSVLLAVGGSAGILLSQNLLFLLIFWEIVTVSLYILISSGGKYSNFAATKSFAMIGASDGALLLGILLVWVISGTLDVGQIKIATNSGLAIVAFLLLLTAALTKAGALPLHTWLPVSGEYAPASAMALLPAAIDKLLGIYLLVLIATRLFTINSALLTFIMAAIGAATIIIAVMIAMVQHNIKKLLSYHAISQVGYMVLGISTGNPVGIAGGLFHMLNHAIYKCCLFLCGGAVEEAAGTPQLDRMGGLGKKMPLTFTACLIAALSISGIPLFNGFVSKWMVYQGVIEMGNKQAGIAAQLWPLWLVAAMFGSALTLASFVKIIHSCFLSRLPDNLKDVKEASLLKTFPMLLLAGLCVFFGIFYYVPLKTFIYPALGIQVDPVILGIWQSSIATYAIIIGIILGIILLLVGILARKVRIVPTWTCGEIQPNEQMIIPGTHFYKTVSNMNGLKQLYSSQEKGFFDLYNLSGKLGLVLTSFLRWIHTGVISTYVMWMMAGVLILLFAVCRIW